jgi:serine/threonine protein kinase/tetratricopeptide (TPR) repeat protein
VLANGTQLGPYQVLSPLGSGGMGEVYRARDTRLDREVAVKVLPPQFAQDPDRLARFEREAKMVAALSHPNILAIHDYGNEQDCSFAVMELLQGETLRRRLAEGRLPWRKAVDIAIAIAEGLAAAHAKGIIHRDLKPENLFLTADGRLKILDFGLARVDPPANPDAETKPYMPAHTEAGTVLGTVGYMSPEQVRGLRVDARSDIFSLGCVLYEMVTGQRAFACETAADTSAAILREQPPEPSAWGIIIPDEMERVIRCCLEKDATERFQSAHDLAFALRALCAERARISGPGYSEYWSAPFRSRRWRFFAVYGVPVALVLASALATVAYLNNRSGTNPEPIQPTPSDAPIESLAVLPFVTEKGDAHAEYLGDGFAISLTNSLSKLRNLAVRPFSSVSRYSGRQADPSLAGRELQVQAVLTGTVQKRGEELLISVELVDVRANKLIWGERYQRPYVNLFAIQEEMALEATERLRLKLTGDEVRRLAQRPTEDLEAYRLYILGRVEWNRRTKEALRRGVDYLERAIEIDRKYALAHSGLADCYNLLDEYGVAPAKEAFPKAKAAAQKALALDPTLAEAHTSLAYCLAFYEWDWHGAEKEYRRALELNPGYATAHQWYGECLTVLGRTDEGIAHLNRACAFDPRSLIIHSIAGWALYNARQYDQAIDLFQKTLTMDAQFVQARSFLGWTYAQKGEYADALAEFQKARSIDKNPEFLGGIGHVYAVSGRRADAERVLDELEKLSKRQYVSPCLMAFIHAGLRQKDRAMRWLEQAADERSAWLVYAKVDPKYGNLRADPQFDKLLRRVGLLP